MAEPAILFAPEAQGNNPLPTSGPNLNVAGTDPDLIKAETGRDPAAEPEKEKEAPKAPETAPAPAAAPQQIFGPREMAEALLMADAEKQRRSEQAQAQQRQWAELQKSFEPPPLPEDREQLIMDERALTQAFVDRDNWFKSALGRQAQLLYEQMQQAQERQRQELLTPVYEMRAENAMNVATQRLYEAGLPNAREVVGELEARLRSGSPEAYWNVVTNPDNVFKGAQMVLMDRGESLPRVAAPPTIGYNPGTPSQSAREVPNDPAIKWAEQMLGIKLRPEYREKYSEDIDAMRAFGGGR